MRYPVLSSYIIAHLSLFVMGRLDSFLFRLHAAYVDVYCPWDVLNYCDSLLDDKDAQPENYWINTSSNEHNLPYHLNINFLR